MPRTGTVSESLHRLWTILGLIPRRPRKMATARLESLLAQQGIEVTRRSIQRDLESLSRWFVDLKCDDRSKPYGWYWDGHSPLLELPAMGVQAAVTFELLRQHLTQVLPRTTAKSLDPHFQRARDILAENPNAKMARWPRKVRVVHQGIRHESPTVAAPILDTVYTALLEERRLAIRYRKRGASEPSDYDITPLGLVLRNGTMILVATFWDYPDINQMLLHRMIAASPLPATAKAPPGFSLDAYIASGALGFRRSDASISLRALIDPRVATTLHESPLSKDQQLTPHASGWEQLSATVRDTTELRTWIRGHGPFIEILAPKPLRKEVAADARATATRYRR